MKKIFIFLQESEDFKNFAEIQETLDIQNNLSCFTLHFKFGSIIHIHNIHSL